jgi:hypothetical protein
MDTAPPASNETPRAPSPLRFDPDEAGRYLALLNGGDANGKFTFVAIDDDKTRNDRAYEKHDSLGALNKFFNRAVANGYGIYVTVNQTDLRGRKKHNILRPRALFADLDGAPLDPVLKWEVPPDIVVESSRGKFHCYWLNDGSVTLDNFDPLQQQLGELFGGDRNARDLSRVLRLPGSWHQKVSKQGVRSTPFKTQIIKGTNYEW